LEFLSASNFLDYGSELIKRNYLWKSIFGSKKSMVAEKTKYLALNTHKRKKVLPDCQIYEEDSFKVDHESQLFDDVQEINTFSISQVIDVDESSYQIISESISHQFYDDDSSLTTPLQINSIFDIANCSLATFSKSCSSSSNGSTSRNYSSPYMYPSGTSLLREFILAKKEDVDILSVANISIDEVTTLLSTCSNSPIEVELDAANVASISQELSNDRLACVNSSSRDSEMSYWKVYNSPQSDDGKDSKFHSNSSTVDMECNPTSWMDSSDWVTTKEFASQPELVLSVFDSDSSSARSSPTSLSSDSECDKYYVHADDDDTFSIQTEINPWGLSTSMLLGGNSDQFSELSRENTRKVHIAYLLSQMIDSILIREEGENYFLPAIFDSDEIDDDISSYGSDNNSLDMNYGNFFFTGNNPELESTESPLLNKSIHFIFEKSLNFINDCDVDVSEEARNYSIYEGNEDYYCGTAYSPSHDMFEIIIDDGGGVNVGDSIEEFYLHRCSIGSTDSSVTTVSVESVEALSYCQGTCYMEETLLSVEGNGEEDEVDDFHSPTLTLVELCQSSSSQSSPSKNSVSSDKSEYVSLSHYFDYSSEELDSNCGETVKVERSMDDRKQLKTNTEDPSINLFPLDDNFIDRNTDEEDEDFDCEMTPKFIRYKYSEDEESVTATTELFSLTSLKDDVNDAEIIILPDSKCMDEDYPESQPSEEDDFLCAPKTSSSFNLLLDHRADFLVTRPGRLSLNSIDDGMEDDSSSVVSSLSCSISVAVEAVSMNKDEKTGKFSMLNTAKSIFSMRKSLPLVSKRKKKKKHSLADNMEVKMPIGERRRLKILDTIPSMGSLLRIIRDEKRLIVILFFVFRIYSYLYTTLAC